MARHQEQQAQLQVLEAAAVRDAVQAHRTHAHQRAGTGRQRAGPLWGAADRLRHLNGRSHLHRHGHRPPRAALHLPQHLPHHHEAETLLPQLRV